MPALLLAAALATAEALFAPLGPGAELPGGWTWAAHRVARDGTVELDLARPDGARATVVATQWRRPERAYARSASWDLFYAGARDVPAALVPALDALAARMRANDPGPPAESRAVRPPAWLLNGAARTTLLLLAAGLFAGAVRLRSPRGAAASPPASRSAGRAECDRLSPADAAFLLGLTLLALAWRLGHSPAAFLHENFYATYFLQETARGPAAQDYGQGWFVLFHDLRAALGPAPQVIFAGTLVLAALTPAMVALAAWALGRDRWTAALAGLLFAAWPVHVRYSRSEDMYVALLPFALAGTALLLERARGGGAWTALAGAAALSFAMQVRPLEMFLPLVPALGAALLAGRRALRLLWPAAALVALLTLPNAWNLLTVEGDPPLSAVRSWETATVRLKQMSVFFIPEITPRVLWALVGLGVVVGLGRARTLAVPALFGALFFGWLYMGTGSVIAAPRLQLAYQPYLGLLAGLGAAALVRPMAACSRAGAGLVAGALLALVALPCLPYVRASYAPQAEWTFLSRALPRLKEEPIATLDRSETAPVFPSLTPAVAAALGPPRTLVPLFRALNGALPEGALYYQGLSCFPGAAAGGTPPMHPLCARVAERFELRPVLTRRVATLPAAGDDPDRVGEVEIGFYRLVPR